MSSFRFSDNDSTHERTHTYKHLFVLSFTGKTSYFLIHELTDMSANQVIIKFFRRSRGEREQIEDLLKKHQGVD